MENQTILFSYPIQEYWERIRLIIREEISKEQKQIPLTISAVPSGMNEKPYYKMEEVCKLFSVSRQTIYDWVNQGLLKPRKIRSRVYFISEEIKMLMSP